VTESQLYDWLEKSRPDVYAISCMCSTLDELRCVMNRATGLRIKPEHDLEDACERWRKELERA
jgi:hypothetical protein